MRQRRVGKKVPMLVARKAGRQRGMISRWRKTLYLDVASALDFRCVRAASGDLPADGRAGVCVCVCVW